MPTNSCQQSQKDPRDALHLHPSHGFSQEFFFKGTACHCGGGGLPLSPFFSPIPIPLEVGSHPLPLELGDWAPLAPVKTIMMCRQLTICHHLRHFHSRCAMLARPVTLCPSVRPPEVGILSKRLHGSSCFWHRPQRLLSTYPTPCFKVTSRHVASLSVRLTLMTC